MEEKPYKIRLFGKSKVGLTSIQRRFCTGQYMQKDVPYLPKDNLLLHDSSCGFDLSLSTSLQIHILELEICIRCGIDLSESEITLLEMSTVKNGAGILLVYDIGNRESFDHIKEFLPKANRFFEVTRERHLAAEEKEPVFMLVGNKCDLADDGKRKVSKEEGENLAKKFNMPFKEVSARENINIDSTFTTLAEEKRKKEDEGREGQQNGGGRAEETVSGNVHENAERGGAPAENDGGEGGGPGNGGGAGGGPGNGGGGGGGPGNGGGAGGGPGNGGGGGGGPGNGGGGGGGPGNGGGGGGGPGNGGGGGGGPGNGGGAGGGPGNGGGGGGGPGNGGGGGGRHGNIGAGQEEDQTEKEYKIMLVGESNVGKTAIMKRFCANQFSEEYAPTYVPFTKMKEHFNVNGSPCTVVVLDTPSKDDPVRFFRGFFPYGPKVDAIIMVYDIANLSSFDQIQDHMRRMKGIFKYFDNKDWVEDWPENPPMFMLVGNKCDLEDDERKVSTEDGKSRAKWFDVPFKEVSARDNTNIDSMFITLVEAIIKKKEKEASDKSTKEILETIGNVADFAARIFNVNAGLSFRNSNHTTTENVNVTRRNL